jgi:hypothetical protein
MDIQNSSLKKFEITQLRKSLMFLHVKELKKLSLHLSLIDKGNKKMIILRICHFLLTKEKLTTPKFPKKSCAQLGKEYIINTNQLMLKGAYKNDLKTRLFFKHLIGPHFHYTAFGIDWLNERWMDGNPPTYLEFADMWEEEYRKRKKSPAAPKEEWAYINFVKKFLINFPKASKVDINQAWQAEHKKQKASVYQHIENLIQS